MLTTRAYLLVLGLAFLLGLLVAPSHAEDQPAPKENDDVFVHTAEGKAKLGRSYSDGLEVKLGRALQGVTKLHITDWFDKDAVSGQLDIRNPTKEKVAFGYPLALFDAKGTLLGCASQTMDVDPGEKTSVGGCLIRMPKAQIKQIATYRITYYEDARDIGER